MIIYIHGFKSYGKGSKPQLLRSVFGENDVYAPNLKHEPTIDIIELQSYIIQTIRNGEKILLVGSSLGGFYTSYLAAKYELDAVLINPSRTPHKSLTEFGTLELFDGGLIEWDTDCNEELEMLHYELENSLEEQRDRLYFYLSTDDEVIEHDGIKQVYPNVKEYDNSKHKFVRFDEIIPDIKEIYKNIK